LSSVYSARGEVRKAISERARLIDLGKATVNDYNSLSWEELFDANVTPKGLEYGQQGNLLSNGNDAPVLHTLAAVYAEVGKIAEAREMILKAMDSWGLDEPNSTCWYIFGRIAEQYGMNDDAMAAFKKVERPDYDWQIPGSTYQLASRRLATLMPSAITGKTGR
jgi:tetratricopeptide (TPR) repeat protein